MKEIYDVLIIGSGAAGGMAGMVVIICQPELKPALKAPFRQRHAGGSKERNLIT